MGKLSSSKGRVLLRLAKLTAVGSLLFLLLYSILIAPIIALLAFTSSQPLNVLFSLTKASQKNGAPTSLAIEQTQNPWLQLLANVPAMDRASALMTPNYAEDQALRVAMLARANAWKEDEGKRQKYYQASKTMRIVIGNLESPLSDEVVLQVLQRQSERSVVTARIVLGLWQKRRANEHLAFDGQAVVRLDEILAWRGIQKHQRRAYGGVGKRVSDGYHWRQQQQVRQDIDLLQHYYVEGAHQVFVGGKVQRMLVASPYLRIVPIYQVGSKEERVMGYRVAPGEWIGDYEENGQHFFVEMDRRILQLNTQNEQHELRIAMYLNEYWRKTGRTGDYKEAYVLSELLRGSMIEIDKANLTSRFAPRIEAALQGLYERGIVGQAPYCLTPVDKTKAQWGNSWLASYWCLQPPQGLIERYRGKSGW